MKLVIKAVLILSILGFLGLAGFAYLGDLSPVQETITKPVVLDAE